MLGDRAAGQSVAHAQMEIGLRMNRPQTLRPSHPHCLGQPTLPACFEKGLPFIVLHAERIRPEPQALPIDQYRMLQLVELFDHPAQSDVGQARFVLRMAATDVRVVAGEPDLAQPRRIETFHALHVMRISPTCNRKMLSILIDGAGMASILDVSIEKTIVILHPPNENIRK